MSMATREISPSAAKRTGVVEGMRRMISESSGMVLIDYLGLTSLEMYELRKVLRASQSTMRVVKNTLMKIACEREKIDAGDNWFKMNTAVAFLGPDPLAGIKSIIAYAKGHDRLKVKGGFLERQVMDQKGIRSLAALPGKREMLTKMAVVMKSPLTRAARGMKFLFSRLVLDLREASKKAGN